MHSKFRENYFTVYSGKSKLVQKHPPEHVPQPSPAQDSSRRYLAGSLGPITSELLAHLQDKEPHKEIQSLFQRCFIFKFVEEIKLYLKK